ncbi:MAG: protein phosphatase 2C domain-containing protein [Verrucomicrobia bacterium]|nr:protein phosphatase 2C domain-containing protein [Verrucomicrobiota bacterium]
MLFTSAAQTDIGLVRHENEDRLLCADDLRLFAVADGIGGLPGGAEAAQTAVTTLLREAQADATGETGIDLRRAFLAANAEVIALAEAIAPDTGLGTTLCALAIQSGHALIANVGDSRCYLFRDAQIRLLTTDDTVENDVKARRSRGEHAVLEDHHRNALTRCIGQPMPLIVEIARHALRAGDQLLVCSDGISRSLSEADIAAHFTPDRSPAQVLAALIAESLTRGGLDNATGVLVRIDAL